MGAILQKTGEKEQITKVEIYKGTDRKEKKLEIDFKKQTTMKDLQTVGADTSKKDYANLGFYISHFERFFLPRHKYMPDKTNPLFNDKLKDGSLFASNGNIEDPSKMILLDLKKSFALKKFKVKVKFDIDREKINNLLGGDLIKENHNTIETDYSFELGDLITAGTKDSISKLNNTMLNAYGTGLKNYAQHLKQEIKADLKTFFNNFDDKDELKDSLFATANNVTPYSADQTGIAGKFVGLNNDVQFENLEKETFALDLTTKKGDKLPLYLASVRRNHPEAMMTQDDQNVKIETNLH